MSSWPVSGLWVIGLFIGIDMIFDGWTEVMLALSAGSARRDHTPADRDRMIAPRVAAHGGAMLAIEKPRAPRAPVPFPRPSQSIAG